MSLNQEQSDSQSGMFGGIDSREWLGLFKDVATIKAEQHTIVTLLRKSEHDSRLMEARVAKLEKWQLRTTAYLTVGIVILQAVFQYWPAVVKILSSATH